MGVSLCISWPVSRDVALTPATQKSAWKMADKARCGKTLNPCVRYCRRFASFSHCRIIYMYVIYTSGMLYILSFSLPYISHFSSLFIWLFVMLYYFCTCILYILFFSLLCELLFSICCRFCSLECCIIFSLVCCV